MAEHIDTAERIRQKAHDLFMQFGLRSVSMDDIANSLGISKKTIYQFFADKDALVNEVVTKILAHNQQCCTEDVTDADNAIHEVFLAIDFMEEMLSTMKVSFLFDMQKYHPDAYLMFAKHKNDFLYSVIKKNLERGMKEELYRAELKIEILSRFRVESVMLPFSPEFQAKLKYSLVEIAEELTMLFLFGLVSQKGYKVTLKYQQERLKKNS